MWIRPSEIGTRATTDTVRAVSKVFSEAGLDFYIPETTLYLSENAYSYLPDDKTIIYVGSNLISVSQVQAFYSRWYSGFEVSGVEIDRDRYLILNDRLYGAAYLAVTCVQGIAKLTSDIPTLAVGDSIIRDGLEVVVEELPFTSMADDMYAMPPAELKPVAASVGRRILSLERDTQELWDTEMELKRSHLLNGWMDIVRQYT